MDAFPVRMGDGKYKEGDTKTGKKKYKGDKEMLRRGKH